MLVINTQVTDLSDGHCRDSPVPADPYVNSGRDFKVPADTYVNSYRYFKVLMP